MALLRIGGLNAGKRREELLAEYEGEEPYRPGGYDTPYDGDEPYPPSGYEDDVYDDDGYDDDYDDEYEDDYGDYEDDYDDGYDDRSRYDDDYGYDEAYGEDGYGDPDDDPYYEDYGNRTGLDAFLDAHEWVNLPLLVLLPPVGIWLLWRRARYSRNVTVGLTVLSALWMALVLALVIFKPFRPRGDDVITPEPVGAGALNESVEAAVEDEPASVVVSVEEVDEANAVYTVDGTPWYHRVSDCAAIAKDSEVNRVSNNTAVEQSLMACPYCLAGQYSDGLWDLKFLNAETSDKSGLRVYCSAYNSHFHTNADCSDIGGDAHEVSLKDALLMGRTACEVCCPSAAMMFYCTTDGTYYHSKDDCSGMRNASQVTYAEARVLGKKRCPNCIGGSDDVEETVKASGYYVYATKSGQYYHVNATCSGMKNAEQVLLSDMIKQNRPPCPKCCADAEMTVFAEEGNPYYHSYATCSGMTNATPGILVNALAAGLTRCPECWKAQ